MWEARGWGALGFRQDGSTLGEVEFGWLPSGSEVGCEKLFLLNGQLEIACRPFFPGWAPRNLGAWNTIGYLTLLFPLKVVYLIPELDVEVLGGFG